MAAPHAHLYWQTFMSLLPGFGDNRDSQAVSADSLVSPQKPRSWERWEMLHREEALKTCR